MRSPNSMLFGQPSDIFSTVITMAVVSKLSEGNDLQKPAALYFVSKTSSQGTPEKAMRNETTRTD